MRIIIETARLIIREFIPNEQDIYLAHFNDEEVCRYIPKRSRDERIGIFNKALANYDNYRDILIWGMFDKSTGKFIGSCLLRPFTGEPGKTELGYSMDRKFWGKGIGTEMAAAMIEQAFADKETNEVVAVTDLANIGSMRVLEKAGMVRMKNLLKDGEELAYFQLKRGS